MSLYREAASLIEGERDVIANTANVSALLYNSLDGLNWAGFYFNRGGGLVLGPFQGKPACIRIPFDKGVCGAAAREKKIQLVRNVHEFPGHIACDSASNSEIVVPILKDGKLLGVLDIDSPLFARFTEDDARELNEIAVLLADSCDWAEIG